MIIETILPAIFSFFVTLLALPLNIIFAKKYKLVDNPKLRPHPAHIQNRIVPRAGGLACFIGILVTVILFIPMQKFVLGILLAIFILLIIGLLDDKKPKFSPYLRLLSQFVAAIVVVVSGIGISFITNPLGGLINFDSIIIPFNFLGPHKIILLADLLAMLWIVWVMNMINWSKGVDGQMPGIVLITSLVLGLVSLNFFLQGDASQLNVAKLAFITTGIASALLIFNWYPAKIFPGFSGSTILGLLIAVLAILSGGKLATAGLVLLIPAIDFIYIFWKRIIKGKSPVWGDRSHLHHSLLKLGWSHQKITLFYMLGSAILGAAALSLDSRGKLYAAILVGAVTLGGILWLNFFGDYLKQSDQDSG